MSHYCWSGITILLGDLAENMTSPTFKGWEVGLSDIDRAFGD